MSVADMEQDPYHITSSLSCSLPMLQLPLQSISEPTVAVWPVSDVLMHQGFNNEH